MSYRDYRRVMLALGIPMGEQKSAADWAKTGPQVTPTHLTHADRLIARVAALAPGERIDLTTDDDALALAEFGEPRQLQMASEAPVVKITAFPSHLIDSLEEAKKGVQKARELVVDREQHRDELMLTADEAGVPVTRIVEAAGVTRARFYQIKDRTRLDGITRDSERTHD